MEDNIPIWELYNYDRKRYYDMVKKAYTCPYCPFCMKSDRDVCPYPPDEIKAMEQNQTTPKSPDNKE